MRTKDRGSLQQGRLEKARRVLSSHDSAASPHAGIDPVRQSEGWRLALAPGVHEWFPSESEHPPPLAVLISLLWRGYDRHEQVLPGAVLWIGRSCWVYPLALLRRSGSSIDRRLLDSSVFIDTERPRSARGDLVWSIEQAARCEGVRAVIADGRELSMAESRRLQIAAEGDRQRRGTPIQIVRTARERGTLSASRSRWLAAPEVSQEHDDRTQGWTVELMRCKGTQPESGGAHRWRVRREHGAANQADWEPIVGSSARDGDMDAPVAHRQHPPARSRTA